jgi:hypothetical protein
MPKTPKASSERATYSHSASLSIRYARLDVDVVRALGADKFPANPIHEVA